MEDAQNQQAVGTCAPGDGAVAVEVTDRGLFDFMGKKEEEKEEKKCEKEEEEVLVTGMEKVSVEETKEIKAEEEKKEKHGLLEKLHRSDSSSSSSSDEEEIGEDGIKKRKKKGLKEKIKEKLHCDKKEESAEEKNTVEAEELVEASVISLDETSIKVEKLEEVAKIEEAPAEEKKGFLEKIREKLPGQHKKPAPEEAAAVAADPACIAEQGKEHEGEAHKKGFLEKIKEKLPGYHKDGEESGATTTHAT